MYRLHVRNTTRERSFSNVESVLAIITETETMYLDWKESEESYNCIQADEENGISEVIPIKSEIVTSKDILLLSKQDEQYNVGYESNFDATVKKFDNEFQTNFLKKVLCEHSVVQNYNIVVKFLHCPETYLSWRLLRYVKIKCLKLMFKKHNKWDTRTVLNQRMAWERWKLKCFQMNRMLFAN